MLRCGAISPKHDAQAHTKTLLTLNRRASIHLLTLSSIRLFGRRGPLAENHSPPIAPSDLGQRHADWERGWVSAPSSSFNTSRTQNYVRSLNR
jgi:hypothetical protein